MSTPALIAYEHPDTRITTVYCHDDGYLEHTGIVLHTLYNQAGKVKQLILHGDMRNIFTRNIPSITIPDRPITGVPDYYASCIGSYLSAIPYTVDDVYELLQRADEDGAEYVYLYRDNEWFVSKPYYKNMPFDSLKKTLQDNLIDFEERCQKFHDAAPYWLQMKSPLWD